MPAPQGLAVDAEALGTRAAEGRAEPSGFFQLTGLPAGAYRLEARLEGFGDGHLPTVILLAGEETRLAEPLQLRPPAFLEIGLQPPTDAYGQPWILSLAREAAHQPGFRETVAQGAPPETGTWEAGPVQAGTYALQVADSQGSVWVEEEVELPGGKTVRLVDVPLVPIEGRVRLGDEPVQGRLWFGGRRRVPNVVVDLDAEGEFVGHLPSEGRWELDLELLEEGLEQALDPVEIEVSEGQATARVDLQLPDTELAVRVVDAAGDGVGGAHLVVVGLQGREKRREALARTKGDGTYRFRGLAPGKLVLRARKGGADSEWTEATAEEGLDSPEVTLRLEELVTVAGRVTRGGAGLAGASVLARMDGSPVRKTAVTGPDGGFEIEVPEGPAVLAVSAPGQGFRLLRTAFSAAHGGDRSLDVPLDAGSGRLVLDLTDPAAARAGMGGLALVAGEPGAASVTLAELLGTLRVPSGDGTEPVLEIAAAEPGDWSLCTGPTACAAGYLAPGSVLELAAPKP